MTLTHEPAGAAAPVRKAGLTPEERDLRRLSIGSSDVAAVLGVSPYASPYDLWLEKTGRVVKDDERPWMRVGSRLEAGVLDEFIETYGGVERNILLERRDLHLACRLDARHLASGAPVESKTAGLFGPLSIEWGDEGSDDVPTHYLVQIHAQMIVAGVDFGYLPALLGGIGFRTYVIPRSPRLSDVIGESCERFWRVNVQGDTPPDGKGSHDILKLTRREPGHVAVIPALYREQFEQLAKAKRDAEAAYESFVDEIRQSDNAAEAFDFGDGEKWFTDYEQSRESIDAKALKAAHPDIYQQFAKTFRYRVLRLAKKPKGAK